MTIIDVLVCKGYGKGLVRVDSALWGCACVG